MRSDWRIIPLAVAACFLAMSGNGGGNVKAEPNVSEAAKVARLGRRVRPALPNDTSTGTLQATFAVTVSLAGTGSGTVTSDVPGINCGPEYPEGDCTEDYPEGTVVILAARPRPTRVHPGLSTFSGWGGDCAGASAWPCVLIMDADKNVTANFIDTSSTNSSFEGKVKDSGTGAPIAGATVGASQGAVLVATTRTRSSGEYTLAVSAGTYDLAASAPGYLARTKTRTVDPDSTKEGIKFNLIPQACSVPAARGYSRMIYDPESRDVYLFGGYSKFSFDQMDVQDVWAFDTEDKTWRLVGPHEVHDFDALAFDAQSRKVIFYNTFVFTPEGVETWAYDIDTNTWQNMEPSNQPPLRWGSRMAYDAESDVVVLFGGTDLNTFEVLADTWTYDYESNTWTKMEPANSPPPHHFHDMVYHAAGDRIVMFGGYDESLGAYLNDTWAYDTNSNQWTQLYPAVSPAPRSYMALAYEDRSEKIVMFGGTQDPANWPYEPTYDETWVFDLDAVSWTQESPEKVPSPRGWHQMVGTGKRVLLFGGGPSRFTYNSDTYIYTYNRRTKKWNWKLIRCE